MAHQAGGHVKHRPELQCHRGKVARRCGRTCSTGAVTRPVMTAWGGRSAGAPTHATEERGDKQTFKASPRRGQRAPVMEHSSHEGEVVAPRLRTHRGVGAGQRDRRGTPTRVGTPQAREMP